jgi:hypothetical protein
VTTSVVPSIRFVDQFTGRVARRFPSRCEVCGINRIFTDGVQRLKFELAHECHGGKC